MPRKAEFSVKDIGRLLRFIGNAGCAVSLDAAKAESTCRLVRPDGHAEVFGQACLQAAAGRGLVLLRQGRIFATSEARPFLRRLLAAREEAFLDQHRIVEIAEIRQDDAVVHVRVNGASSPLAALARLKDSAGQAWFAAEALSAGERLAADFHYGNLQPRITPSYAPRLGDRTGSAPGAGTEMKDSVVAARQRVSRAIEAMGPELAGVALDICCFEKGLELVERERQWPARSAKLMLKTALLHLHRHYQPAPPSAGRRHAWSAEGDRPAGMAAGACPSTLPDDAAIALPLVGD